MLKKIHIALVLSFFAATPVFANAVITSAANFTEVQQMIEQVPHPHHTLLALDDDDTLTMMPCSSPAHCQYLGGPAWFSWQSGLAANDPNRIWTTFDQLLQINSLIFSMSEMVLDDPAIPQALTEAGKRGVKTIIETSRGYDMTDVTERQLSEDNILSIIENGALKTPHDHISFSGPYLPQPTGADPVRPIAYTDGIFYTEGQNKGIMLQQLLEKADQTKHISEIIFVDDTEQNVVDVANAYKNDPNVTVICVHYTGTDAHKAAFTTGPNAEKLQATANSEWYAIRDNLRQQLPGFTL